jgi:hypothetical protein
MRVSAGTQFPPAGRVMLAVGVALLCVTGLVTGVVPRAPGRLADGAVSQEPSAADAAAEQDSDCVSTEPALSPTPPMITAAIRAIGIGEEGLLARSLRERQFRRRSHTTADDHEVK